MTPTEQRFWSKVSKGKRTACWLWQGHRDKLGYGKFRYGGKAGRLAHRYSYELLVGPIARGLEIDHLCRITSCVNPTHLEAVTPKVNTMRSPNCSSSVNRRKTHCPKGHPLAGENLVMEGKARRCYQCKLKKDREAQRRRSARNG